MTADLERFRTDRQILGETAQQVQKDFTTCGLDIGLGDEEVLPYEVLLGRVRQQVEQSLRGTPDAFHQLLYRVDIPEKNYVRLQHASADFVTDLSKLIPEREFMKVVSRRLYSEGK
jgi:hypothetical protein